MRTIKVGQADDPPAAGQGNLNMLGKDRFMRHQELIARIEKEVRLLYRFAILAMGNQEAACGAVQESCAAVFHRLTGRETAERLQRLLLTELYCRSREAETAYQPEAVLAAFPAATAESRELIASLAGMERRYRATLALRFACGLTQEQALAIMGGGEQATGGLLSQALARLKEASISE